MEQYKRHYRIAICDDEPAQADLLKNMVSAWAEKTACTTDIALFASAEAFLFEYKESNPFDILLLDVEMPAGVLSDPLPTGLSLAKKIRETDRRAKLIFVTSHFEFMSEGYEVDALHYLVKPVSQDKLSAVLSRAAELLSVEPPSVLVNCDGETVKLTEDKILYVESFLHYICIHTMDGEYKVKEGISVFEDRLSDLFYRIHRSYLVSLAHIVRISRTSVTLENGTTLPLARGQYDNINRAFIEHN